MLTFIQLLGGIAAQGASIVFGPANLCFNALQFLIEIPAAISKFYNDLALLFQEISTFMKQFKIYERIEEYARVDIELKQGTHKLMIIFVDICAISIDVLSGSKLKKFKTMAKIALFDNDSGIRAKLDEFQRLISHQSQISDAVTLEYVLKSEFELTNSMKTVFEMLNRSSEDSRKLLEEKSQEIQDELKDTHDDVKTVKAGTEVLVKDAIDRSDLKKHQEYLNRICRKLPYALETIQKLEKEVDQIRTDSLEGTGLWLKEIDVYRHWIDLDPEASHLLVLSGSSGSGKSNLAFAVLDYMKTRHSAASSSATRVSIAHYRFIRNEKQSRDDAVKDSFRSISAQLASQNFVYSKNLSSHLERKDLPLLRDMSVKDFPRELIPPPNMKDVPDTAYVLLFDGLDQLSHDDANRLVATILAMKPSKVRIIMTGTEDVFRSCFNHFNESLESIPHVRVADFNEVDIKRFIDSELKASKVLQGNAREISQIRDSIRENLPEVVEGNFSNARQVIERVNEAVKSEESVEDIARLISVDTLRNRDAATARLVEELNESLNAQEIEQLNELLVWTTYAFDWMTIEEMRAALFLRTKRTPLQSLEDKVNQKYFRLLQISPDRGGVFDMKDTYLEDFFRNSKRESQESDSDTSSDPKISMTLSIDHVRLSQVQRFFWDLSEKIVLDRFAFVHSLTDRGQHVKISANKVEAHLAISRRCFDVLLDEPKEETQILAPYAFLNLPSHLFHLKEDIPAENVFVKPTERVRIVEDLILLLQSVEFIEKHLSNRFFEEKCWLDEKWDLPTFEAWLRESQVDGKLSRKALSWVKQVETGGRLIALKEIAAMVARHWLCQRMWPTTLTFQWIDGFLDRLTYEQTQRLGVDDSSSGSHNKNQSEQISGGQDTGDDHVDEPITMQARILRAAKWAENEVKITKNALWYERLGATYLNNDEVDLSKETFSTAKTMPGWSWRVSYDLAEAYAISDQKSLAINEMEIVFRRFREQETIVPEDKAYFVQGLNKAAGWNTEMSDTTDAMIKLREAITLDEYHYPSHYQLLKTLLKTGQDSEALKLFNDMRTHPAKENSLTQLQSMLLEFSNYDDPLEHFETVFHSARQHDQFHVILETLQTIIAYARDNAFICNLIDLLLCYGIALAGHSTEENRLETALEQWTECYRRGFRSENSRKWDSALWAARYAFNHHFSGSRSTEGTAGDFEVLETRLRELTESASLSYAAYKLRLSLGSFYTLSGKQEAAQKLLLNDMKMAVDLLSDDDPGNDYIGYANIANILMHTGDDLNALSGWSLYGPEERYKEDSSAPAEKDDTTDANHEDLPPTENLHTEPESSKHIGYHCDGRCNKPWTYADSIWFCKVCDDVQFDDECLEKLRKGTLTRFVCSPDHEWLRVSSWTDEYRATGKGRVRTGGELQDGKRVGGEIVAVDVWLDTIREKWGIEKPKSEDQKETEAQNDGI